MTLFVFLQMNFKRAFLDSKVQTEEMSIHTRGVTIRVFVLNCSVRGFRLGTDYKLNDSLD